MTIDTSREAVERLLDDVTPSPWAASEHQWPDQVGCCPLVGRPFSAHKNMLNVAAANTKADIHFIAASRELVPALLAERDAALAEVARLSTALAETEALEEQHGAVIERLQAEITRLSQALVAETVKREAMEEALRTVETDLAEAEDKFHIASFYISDEQTKTCVMDRVKWMAKAGSRVRATLAKHGSK